MKSRIHLKKDNNTVWNKNNSPLHTGEHSHHEDWNNTMKDCVGNELHIGDNVVCCDGYYSELLIGKVVRFTEHMIICECVRANNQKGDYFQTRKYPNQVHLVYYPKVALKQKFINDDYDTPYTDYMCSTCENKDVYEEDIFCSKCGSKFVDNNYLIEKAMQSVYNSFGCNCIPSVGEMRSTTAAEDTAIKNYLKKYSIETDINILDD